MGARAQEGPGSPALNFLWSSRYLPHRGNNPPSALEVEVLSNLPVVTWLIGGIAVRSLSQRASTVHSHQDRKAADEGGSEKKNQG